MRVTVTASILSSLARQNVTCEGEHLWLCDLRIFIETQ